MKIKGFSLVEVLVVITIMGMLAAVAVPSYQKYVTKTKVATALASVVEPFKLEIEKSFLRNGGVPDDISLKNPKYISSIKYTKVNSKEADIVIQYEDLGAGGKDIALIYTAIIKSAKVSYECSSNTKKTAEYAPVECQ